MHWSAEPPGADDYAVVTTSGTFSVAEHLRMIDDVVGRPWWRPGTDVLFDHRGLDFGDADLRSMYEAGANHLRNDSRIGDGKAAILVGSLSDFGRGRQFEQLTEGRVAATMHVFLDEAEARDWLAGQLV